MCGIKMDEDTELASKICIPCQGGVPPLSGEEMVGLISKLNEEWEIIDNHHLLREWKFKDFKDALEFTNITGSICEEQNHHADFELGWGRVKIKIFTHKIDGLVESDFILAAKFDCLD
jgi:4a-hydroxytetrahydrobiopterin dehydratase|tara:strand:+ start:116 stop:469 length:354 start_codon:yes stop_codon:yes gene_type:complete